MKPIPFLQRCAIFLIDFTTAVFLYNIISFIISYFYFLPLLPGLIYIWLLYYITCLGVWKQTLGMAFFEGYVIKTNGKTPSRLTIILKELFTSVPTWLLICLLIMFSRTLDFSDFSPVFRNITAFSLLLFIIVSGILTIFQRRIFKIHIRHIFQSDERKKTIKRKRLLIIYIVILIMAGLFRILNTFITNDTEWTKHNLSWTTPRHTAHSVKKYTDYLQENRMNINDYVFDLFRKYDHVILCERMHPEMTQYDMIYNLVTDSRFVDSVGVVFTEIGSADSRDSYKKFAAADFPNDTVVKKELASFMMENQAIHLLWTNTNWFNFLEKMYYFNHDRDNKVDILFTDADWTFNDRTYNRDSLMAYNIISTIRNNSLKKSLTIMNYRHAFLIDSPDGGNCGAYIAAEFPGKVANILIHTASLKYLTSSTPSILLLPPIQRGKWDAAFEEMPDSAFAFNLKGSPFGKDNFDNVGMENILFKKHYEDMFMGLIYYLPLHKHIISQGYPYMIDKEREQILYERGKLKGIDEIKIKNWMGYYKSLNDGKIIDTKIGYFRLQYIENCFFYVVFCIGIIITLSLLYSIVNRQNKLPEI